MVACSVNVKMQELLPLRGLHNLCHVIMKNEMIYCYINNKEHEVNFCNMNHIFQL